MWNNRSLAFFLVIVGVAGVHSHIGSEKFKNYKGEVKNYNHERHPLNLCKNALNVEYAKWVGFPADKDKCSKSIKCSTLKGDREIVLEEKPEDGVVCFSFRFGFEWDYEACINGKCVELERENLQNPSSDIVFF